MSPPRYVPGRSIHAHPLTLIPDANESAFVRVAKQVQRIAQRDNGASSPARLGVWIGQSCRQDAELKNPG
ncbi:hypothetical protein M378DRAFT_164134 [Amanita muscaria Koide BX008]|uniref:Uncharacterized protein n=1 Tax=Amanita muscaria (strain Koide BX008) TaxID=946122 RepID=A0A0C2TAH3_AMAMK|nr:hypothetical protein M378DRAFT_164134 [Amanita muscaria Koide BX008]